MKRYRVTAVEAAAPRRRPGYLAAVLAMARRDGQWLLIEDDQAQRLAREYRQPTGAASRAAGPAQPDMGDAAAWDAFKDRIRASGDPSLYDLLVRHLQAWETGPTAAACSKCERRRRRELLWHQCAPYLNHQEPPIGTPLA